VAVISVKGAEAFAALLLVMVVALLLAFLKEKR
jgi:hypothetical protein